MTRSKAPLDLSSKLPRVSAWIGAAFLAWSALGQDSSPTFHHDPQRTGRAAVVGPSAPILRWAFKTRASLDASPVTAADGTIYISSTDNHLYAISPAGSLKWAFVAKESIFSTPALGSDGTIYFADQAGWYYAVNPDGTLKWERALQDGGFERRVMAAPAVSANGQSFVGTWSDFLYSFGPDGDLLWKVFLGGEGQMTAAPALDRAGNVYLATLDPASKSSIAVIKLDSGGRILWKFTESLGNDRNRIVSSPAIDTEGSRLYVGASRTDDGCLYAVSLDDGRRIFRVNLAKGIVSSPAIGPDGTVYVGCLDGKLYAVNPADGRQYWAFVSGAYVIMGSPSVDGAGRIYTGDSDGVVHALSPSGGKLWSFATQSNIASAPVIAGDGTLYVTSYDSTLYAIGSASRLRTRPR